MKIFENHPAAPLPHEDEESPAKEPKAQRPSHVKGKTFLNAAAALLVGATSLSEVSCKNDDNGTGDHSELSEEGLSQEDLVRLYEKSASSASNDDEHTKTSIEKEMEKYNPKDMPDGLMPIKISFHDQAPGGAWDDKESRVTTKTKSANNSSETENTPPNSKKEISQEQKDAMLKHLGITKDQIKPEYLVKFLEGKYENIVIVDLKTQSLNMYDKDGSIVLENIHISSGKKGDETSPMSCESGVAKELHINGKGQEMPDAVLLDPNTGIYIHEGDLPGFPASKGCIRTDPVTAKTIRVIAGKRLHNLVFVIK